MSENARRPAYPPDFAYWIIRKHQGPKYYGLGMTQLEEEIEKGNIPKPKALSSGGRAQGWTGQQIIDHHERLFQEEENATPIPNAEEPGG